MCFSFCSLEDGRLFDYLVAHDELMEEKVAYFVKDTLEALQHLHTCRVAHLDLKVGLMLQIDFQLEHALHPKVV